MRVINALKILSAKFINVLIACGNGD